MSKASEQEIADASDDLFERMRPSLDEMSDIAWATETTPLVRYLALQRVLAAIGGLLASIRGTPCARPKEKLEAGARELDVVAGLLREGGHDS